MIIDFKEIPQANKGGGTQDKFELFSRDFIELLGYEIISDPARGADGGIDFKVKEVRATQNGNQNIFWLASCKHYAHSGVGINPNIESNILDRVTANGCQGFIGIYSTIPTNGLVNILQGLANHGNIEYKLFDHEKIESHIVGISTLEHLFIRYFPESFKKWKEAYYFREPLKLFENFLKGKCEESIRNILLEAFHSTGNFIKSLRRHNRIEDALSEHGVRLIHDSTFHRYEHRRDLKYISDTEPFQIRYSQKDNFSYVFKHSNRILNAYLQGEILPEKGFGLVKADESYIYEKVKYKFGLTLPFNSCLFWIISYRLRDTIYQFTSLIIVGDAYYQYLNDLFQDMKQMLD